MIPQIKTLPLKHFRKQTQAEYFHMVSLFLMYPNHTAPLIRQHMLQHFEDVVGLNWIRYLRRELGLNTVPVGYPRGKPRINPEPKTLAKQPESTPILKDGVGLLILDELLQQFVLETLNTILQMLAHDGETSIPIHSVEKIRDLLLIFGSGKVKRLSQYEPGMLEGVRYSPDTLMDFLDELAYIPGLAQVWNECFLDFWCRFLDDVDLWDGWIYLDGHGKPFFSKSSMLCGKVSASNRILPITKSVMVHQRQGFCIWYESTPPNTHYGETFFNLAVEIQSLLSKPGLPVVEVACTDREGNSREKGIAYSGKGLLHLSCLKSNEYKGLDDFEIHHQEGKIYVGCWQDESKRVKDPRTFVLKYHIDHWVAFSVAGLTTPKKALSITKEYRSRQEVQENAIKEQISQLDFNVNYGNKVTGEFEVSTKEGKKLEKKMTKLQKRKAKEEARHFKRKGAQEKQKERLRKLNEEILAINKKLKALPKKRVRDRDRRKDDLVSLIKLLGHNIVLLLGVLVKWHGLSQRRTEKLNKYILRRQGYVKELPNITLIYLLPPHRRKTRDEIRDFINTFNKLDFRCTNGKWLKLGFVGET